MKIILYNIWENHFQFFRDDTKLSLLSQKWPGWGPILLRLAIIRGLTISQYSKNGKNSALVKKWLHPKRLKCKHHLKLCFRISPFKKKKLKTTLILAYVTNCCMAFPNCTFFSNFRPVCNLCLLQSVYNQGINDPDCQKFTLIKLNQCHCHVNQNSKQIWST